MSKNETLCRSIIAGGMRTVLDECVFHRLRVLDLSYCTLKDDPICGQNLLLLLQSLQSQNVCCFLVVIVVFVV
jgi:hypothetical protein